MAGTTTRVPRKSAPATAAKKAAATRAVPREAPIGRFAELRAEVIQEDYLVTATLSIAPPDKDRTAMVAAAQTAYVIARNQLEGMMTPLPDPTAQDGYLRDDQGAPVYPPIDEEQLKALQKLVNDAADAYDRALFGESYADVMEYFQGEQGVVWNAFYADIQDTFLPNMEGGKCPTCGHVQNQEQAGNALGSTTSSSSTGTE